MILAWFCLLWAPTVAAEAVKTQGRHSDRDFYRVISCGAMPGERCQKSHKRWSVEDAADLTIGLYQVQLGYPRALRDLVMAAFQDAVGTINAAGAAVTLRWIKRGQPDIRVYLVAAKHSEVVGETGLDIFDGTKIANARVVSDRRGNQITFAAIAMSSSLDPTDIRSVALEETFQALGFIYDIDNPDYASETILYERDSLLEGLGAQDIVALRMKYAY